MFKVNCLLQGPVNEAYQAWGVKYEFTSPESEALIPLFWYEGRIGNLSKTATGKTTAPGSSLSWS